MTQNGTITFQVYSGSIFFVICVKTFKSCIIDKKNNHLTLYQLYTSTCIYLPTLSFYFFVSVCVSLYLFHSLSLSFSLPSFLSPVSFLFVSFFMFLSSVQKVNRSLLLVLPFPLPLLLLLITLLLLFAAPIPIICCCICIICICCI